MKYSPTEIARQFLFIREAQSQPNKGLRVEAIQKWSSGQAGDSWCCEFATMVLDICFQGTSPIPRLQACQDVYNLAKKNHWLVDYPQAEDLFLYVNDADHAHHIGIVTLAKPLIGIAGNTSEDGTSSNGDRVAEHSLNASPNHIKFVRFPK